MLAQLNENMSNIVPFSEGEQETDVAIQEEAPTLSQINTTYVNTPRFEIDARERAKTNAIQQHDEWLEQYRNTPDVNIPEWFSLLWNTAPKENVAKGFPALQENAPINSIAKTLLQKLYTDYGKNLYEQKYNEYLNEHPIKPGTGIGYDPYIGIQHNPLVQRQQEAHNYAVKQSGYIGNNSTTPYREIDKTFGDIAIGTTALMPLIGASAGAFGAIPKIAADIKFGYDGAKALVSPNGVPKTWNFIKQGRYGRALRSGAWDLLNFSLAKQGVRGIKSFGNYAKDVANVAKFNIWNRPNKFRMEYPWQRTQEVLPDVIQPYSKSQSSYNAFAPMQLSTLYKHGGILKNQIGGLVYKPYIPEQNESKQISSATLSYEPEESDNESFRVEPVRIYTQTMQNTVPEEHEVIESPIQEQETPVQVDNTRVQKPVQEYKGKIYKSSEKEQFKEDLYNAYFKALMQRGLDEVKASEFAKRLTTQDILESNWGQSSLSKDFNFGGIKDFSGNGAVKDTTEVVNGKSVKVKQPFRKFANIDEYVNYKINLVDKKWKVFGFNPDKYYSLIVSGKQKYATDPNYVAKLTNLYKQIWK